MDGVFYNMTNLSQFLGGGVGQDDDSRKEGPPLFAMYGGDFNTNFDVILRDTTSLNTVGSPWSAITSSTASYSHGQSSSTQSFGYNGDAGTLSSVLSTQGWTSYTTFTQSLFQNNQYPHFMFGSCSSQGRMSWLSPHQSFGNGAAHQVLMDVTNMPEGCRPRRLYGVYNNTFNWWRNSFVTAVNSGYHIIDKINLASYSTRANGYSTSNGMATYNEATKTLVVVWGGASQTFDCTVYKGTVNLNKVAKLSDYFDTASIKNFSVSSCAPVNLGTLNYSNSMHIDNNDRLLIHWSYSNTAYLHAVSLASAGGSVTGSQVSADGQTTSYGPEQGLVYRPKLQTTWDHKWIVMYRPYYYYGNGYQAYFISAEDNTRWFKANFTVTAGGGAFFPAGRTGFVFFYGDNADSSGLQTTNWDFTRTSTTGTSNTTVGISTAASNVSLTTYTNGGTLPTATEFVLPGYFYSTNYPRYATVNWWPKDNIQSDMFDSSYLG